MELINLENCRLDLVGMEVAMATAVIVMDTENGTGGGKLMDSCVEMIMIATGSIDAYIAKTTN